MIGLVALALLTTGETPVDPWAPVKASAPPPPAPKRHPLPVAPSATPIKHIVYIVKENRTYDNLFGRFPEGDGATTGKVLDGTTIPLGRLPDKQVDLQHNHFWAVRDINGGLMNGFSATKDKAGHTTTLAYTTASRVPNTPRRIRIAPWSARYSTCARSVSVAATRKAGCSFG